MTQVHITNVRVLDNPASFLNPFQFEITFECMEDLAEDLEWKIIYVGSAETEDYDQTLDTVLVGPVSAGRHMFVFQAGPPDQSIIPENDVLGVTVSSSPARSETKNLLGLVTMSITNMKILSYGKIPRLLWSLQRWGENISRNNSQLSFSLWLLVLMFIGIFLLSSLQVVRNILDSKPRVTRFTIDWEQTGDSTTVNNENVPPPSTNLPNQQCVGPSGSGIPTDTAANKFIHEASAL
ncbi:putative histone chaperone ASF1A [Apostichopus japonicus]|uniref:Putative histone chaperone ASF1A n=1 Tax=Stichopus japonicus TaxID=307972 RepID=A0A2G8KZR8_STIJA|nr:putative histone chaperone ASF1A [Apostichopus japonicus]